MKRTSQDRRWSKQVRARDGYTCRRCGTTHAENSFGLHAAHIFSRGILRLRLDIRNGVALCYGCHRWFDSRSKEDREAFVRSLIGDVYDVLLEIKNNPAKRRPVA